MAVKADDQARDQIKKLNVWFSGEDARRVEMRAIRAPIIKEMNDLGEGVDNVMIQTSVMVNTPHINLAAVIDIGSRAACKDLINLSVADYTVASLSALTTDSGSSAPTSKAVTSRGSLFVDVDTVP